MERISLVLEKAWQAPAWKRALKAAKILEAWPRLVGQPIARAARPLGYARGALILEVCDHIWLQRLRFEERKILKLLNEACGERVFERLRLVLGRRKHPLKQSSPSSKPLPEKIKRAYEEELSALEDEDLRQAFLKLRLTLAQKRLRGLR